MWFVIILFVKYYSWLKKMVLLILIWCICLIWTKPFLKRTIKIERFFQEKRGDWFLLKSMNFDEKTFCSIKDLILLRKMPAEITHMTDSVKFSKMGDKEKEEFCSTIILKQIYLAKLLVNKLSIEDFWYRKEFLMEFVKELNVKM